MVRLFFFNVKKKEKRREKQLYKELKERRNYYAIYE